MKRSIIIVLTLLGVLALNGVAAGSASAACVRVRDNLRSNYRTDQCTGTQLFGGWTETKEVGTKIGEGIYCVKVDSGDASEDKNSTCTEKDEGTGEYTEVIEEAPLWSIRGTRLVAGKTHNIAGHVYKSNSFSFTIPEQGAKITCTAMTLEKGVLLGSNEGAPGRDGEIMKFSGCSLVEGNGEPSCALESSTLTTTALRSILVENVAGGVGGGQILEELFPETGSTLVTLKFSGSGCTITETVVTGKVASEFRADSADEEKIEPGQATSEATSWLNKFPEASIKEVWLITNAVGKVAKTQLLAFGDAATLAGTSLVLLANTKFEPEQTDWIPLP